MAAMRRKRALQSLANGPEQPSTYSPNAVRQLHQTGHSNIVQHFRSKKADCAGHSDPSERSGQMTFSAHLYRLLVSFRRLHRRQSSKGKRQCQRVRRARPVIGSPSQRQKPECFLFHLHWFDTILYLARHQSSFPLVRESNAAFFQVPQNCLSLRQA